MPPAATKLVAMRRVKAFSRTRDKSPRKLARLAHFGSTFHNCLVRCSIIRRVASLLFILAFIASAQAYAMPMMGPVKAPSSMAGMAQGSSAGSCKACDQSGAPMKADCTAMCAAVFALALPVPAEHSIDRKIARAWTSDTLSSRAITPDTSPPRT